MFIKSHSGQLIHLFLSLLISAAETLPNLKFPYSEAGLTTVCLKFQEIFANFSFQAFCICSGYSRSN